jgi:Zn-finger nucleic acid-binding protein
MDTVCPICGTKLVITVRLDYCPSTVCDYADYYERY